MEFYIRPVKAGDGAGINELRRMVGVFENILGMPSERIKQNEDIIANMDDNTHAFVAVSKNDDGSEIIIGSASLNVFPNHRKRHRATIGIFVHKDFHGKGVGKKLMETLLELADNWLMLVRVELAVYVENESAIKLYKKFGFEVEGIMKKAIIRNGTHIDEYLMARVK
ncbi:MAG: GNAT family N-acetyltransferase [Defluviitaleaceae bacterium]|nr:GNAT family N-acetyltransferase [Defluviitaleaceae bacterium]